MTSQKSKHEIEHGKYLASNKPELLWGWGSPAGKVRAIRRAELIMSAGELDETTAAIEIGCGNGNFTEVFAKSGAKIFALDISPDLIQLANQRKLPEEQISFVCKRFEDFDAEQEIDALIGSSVLHHLEINEALQNIYRLLHSGGFIAFAEPNFLNPQVFAERTFMRPFLDYVSPDETAFTRWGITNKLAAAGFTNIQVTPFDWLHPAVPESMIGFVSGIGKIFEKTPIIREFSGSLLITGQKE